MDLLVCEDASDPIFRVDGHIMECLNIYDIRLEDTFPACGSNWPYELSNITHYLQVRFQADDSENVHSSSPFAEEGCHRGLSRNREIYRLGGMRVGRTRSIDEPKLGVLCGFFAQDSRENTYNVVRWRPRLDLQLRWHRGTDFCPDVEWRNGIG